MVFRKDTKVDSFQRQISALRQQLGDGDGVQPEPPRESDGAVGIEPRHYPTREQPASPSFAVAQDNFAPLDAELPEFSAPTLDRQTSVVAHDTVWNGDLQTDGTVHVHGRVEGSVTAKHDVFVADEAEVSASIVAENVSVAGLVRGTVRCGNRFEVLPQGRVAGDVFAPVLVVHEGATINGQFKMVDGEGVAEVSPVAPSMRRRTARSGS